MYHLLPILNLTNRRLGLLYKIRKKIIIIVFAIFLCVVFCGVSTHYSTPIPCDRKKIIDNATAYIMLSQVYITDYKEHESDSRYDYSKGYKKEEGYFIKCYTDEYVFYLEREAFLCSEVIENTYYVDEQCWEYVRVNDNFVVFGNINGRASIIYSANDKKPSFVNDPNSIEKHIYVKKLADHLYFAAKR